MKFRPFVSAAFGVALLAGLAACAPHPTYPTTTTTTTTTTSTVPADPDCYAGTSFDLRLVGPVGTANNATLYTSTGGSCTGDSLPGPAIVSLPEPSAIAVLTACGSLDPAWQPSPLNGPVSNQGFATVPLDWFFC